MEDFFLMSIVTTFSALASSSQAAMRPRRASESCLGTSSAGGVLLRAPSSAVGILCWLSFRHQTHWLGHAHGPNGRKGLGRSREPRLDSEAHPGKIDVRPRPFQDPWTGSVSATGSVCGAAKTSFFGLLQGSSAGACALFATTSWRRFPFARKAVEDTRETGPVRKVHAGGGVRASILGCDSCRRCPA